MTALHWFSRHRAVAAVVLLALPAAAWAQAYPDKPVTIISDAAAGASPDVATRFIADGLGRLWGQKVIVLNRPGANGSIGARAAAEAVADGYTLYAPTLSTFVALPTVAPNLPVRLPRDFLPIGFIADQPMFIAVNPSLGIATLPQLIERAKQEPGKISIALTGIGRMTHLTGELLQQRAGIKLLSVPYARGPASAIGDVASGRVSMIIEGFSGIIGAVKAGEVKLIATAAPTRLPEFPDLPTAGEAIPDFSAAGWLVLVAPVGTPAQIIARISVDLAKVVTDADIKKRLGATGSYPRAMTAEETRAFVAQQQATWLPVLQGISGELKSK
ncbi:MAG TPA: tripartite tricarboxylate transporter substrate binding protein [Xanthobacteraceae bacterium]